MALTFVALLGTARTAGEKHLTRPLATLSLRGEGQGVRGSAKVVTLFVTSISPNLAASEACEPLCFEAGGNSVRGSLRQENNCGAVGNSHGEGSRSGGRADGQGSGIGRGEY